MKCFFQNHNYSKLKFTFVTDFEENCAKLCAKRLFAVDKKSCLSKTKNNFVIISQNCFVILAENVFCKKREMIVGFEQKTISRKKREIISRN